VQHRSTTTTSLYFIPCVIAGAVTNIAAGLLVYRVKANHIALAGAIASAIAPVLLANMNLEGSYWGAAFWAMCLTPLSADGLSPQIKRLTDSPLYNLKFSYHRIVPNSYPSLGRRRFQHRRANWEFGRVGHYIDYRGKCDRCGEEFRGK
jgi:hypothetical protein